MASRSEIAAQDILTQHRATGEPVAQLVSKITRSRNLGSQERRWVTDQVFNILRQKAWPDWFQKRIQKQYGPQTQELEQTLRTRPPPTKAAPDGLWLDPGSRVIAQQVQAKPGEQVLDLCAGQGGKTKLLLQTGAQVTSVDISEQRLAKIPGVKRIVADATQYRFKQDFDWILVDAPCSGTGTLRRAPDLFGRLQEKDLEHYVQLQKALVHNAMQFLKPSGYLVYATCSVLEEENHTCFEGLQLIKSQYLLPHQENTDGFFVAIFMLY